MTCDLNQIGREAKRAAFQMAQASSEQKNAVLRELVIELKRSEQLILQANQKDIEAAQALRLDAALIDRLSLQGRLQGIADDIEKIIQLEDPIGELFEADTLPNGLKLSKQRVPLGVIGIIYEARPNVTLDVASLCVKTGNCAILRGGSETINSNRLLVHLIQNALQNAGLPKEAIQLIEEADRAHVLTLLRLHQYVDLIIPRGGAGLHQFCKENSTIPVIIGGIGICHLFVDDTADFQKSIEVIHNAKTQRPTVCNALDTLLVHEKVASQFLPQLLERLAASAVSFRLDEKAWDIVTNGSLQKSGDIKKAEDQDWDREWLSLILGIKIVKDLSEAIAHIHKHSSGHSDGILTQTVAHAERFLNEVDSAAVYHNASTRFTDGGQFGLGAEVAISTQKLHARGPMGLKELTSYKWIVQGDYHVRK